MTNKKVFFKFTAYKHFETSYDPNDSLKYFCEENGLQFSDVEIENELHECRLCNRFTPLNQISTDNLCENCQAQEDCSHPKLDDWGDCMACGKEVS